MEMKGGASKFVGMLGRVGTEVAGARLDTGLLERSSRGGYGTGDAGAASHCEHLDIASCLPLSKTA